MKKLISIILIVVVLLSLFSFTTFAENLYGCKDAFYEEYNITANGDKYLIYNELGEMDVDYDDAMDFVMLYAEFPLGEDAVTAISMGERFIINYHISHPFEFGYGFFDLETREFIPLSEEFLNEYPMTYDYLDEFDVGEQYGDADCDGELTVLDATFIQRALASIEEFTYQEYLRDWGLGSRRRSDFDDDYKVTVMDATAIQHKLAKQNK